MNKYQKLIGHFYSEKIMPNLELGALLVLIQEMESQPLSTGILINSFLQSV